MRALLFNPWITDFAAFDHWTRPLNLLRLSTLLKQCGMEVDLYDCLDRNSPDLQDLPRPPRHRLNAFGCGHYYREVIPHPSVLEFVPRHYKRYGVPPDRVEAHLRHLPSPDLIIVASMMTYWYPGVFEAIAMLRRLFPRAVIILGGVYATLCREHAERFSEADAVITGPHWPSLVNHILEIAGEKQIRCGGDQSLWIEPDYSFLRGETCLPFLTSTGCPFTCTYCATHELWPHYVPYEHEAILDSLERMVRDYGATDAAFFDDALLIRKQTHFMPLMEAWVRRGIPLRFHTPNALHVRHIDRETAHLLKRAGFKTLRLGLELLDRGLQKETGGKVFTEEYVRAMGHLRDAGFSAREIGTYILYGIPGQTLETIQEACRFVAEQGSEIKIALYSPIPLTPMYAQETNDFLFDPTRDPLLHNCSLVPWRTRSVAYEEYQTLQQTVVSLNHSQRVPAIPG